MLNTAINAYNKKLEECSKSKYALDVTKNNLDNVQAEYDQAIKDQKAQADVVADTTKKLDDANESLTKAKRATADWEGIKSGTSDHYAPYHDEVLDNLSDTVLVYVSAKDAAGSIETKLADAQKDYDEKTKNYKNALNAYNTALYEYNDAKANLDTFSPTDKKDDVTTTPSDKKDNVTVTPTQKKDITTTVKSDKTSTTVKTGDSSPIVIFNLLLMLSMFFYTLLRRKENKE